MPIKKSISQSPEMVNKCIKLLASSNRTKKEVANTLGIDLGFVMIVDREHKQEIDAIKSAINNDKTSKKKITEEIPKVEKVIEVVEKENQKKRHTEEDKLQIGILYEDGVRVKDIAEKYGLTSSRISQIVSELGLVKKKEDNDLRKSKKSKPSPSKIRSQKKIEEKENKIVEMKIESAMARVNNKQLKQQSQIKVLDNISNQLSKDNEPVMKGLWKTYLNNANIEIKPIEKLKTVRCGLIDGRHNMPVSKYVYKESFDQELMFNFDEQYDIAIKFIEDNIKFDDKGIPQKNIILYTTGYQAALVSFLKACDDKKINVSVMHYNAVSSTYVKQVFSDVHKDNNNNLLENDDRIINLCDRTDEIFTYNCDILDLFQQDTFFMIKIFDYGKGNSTDKVEYCTSIVVKEFDDIWRVYPEICKTIIEEKEKYNWRFGVFVLPITNYKESKTISFGGAITKLFSFTDKQQNRNNNNK